MTSFRCELLVVTITVAADCAGVLRRAQFLQDTVLNDSAPTNLKALTCLTSSHKLPVHILVG